MKHKHICPKCDHRKILGISQVGDAVGVSTDHNLGQSLVAERLDQEIPMLSQPMRVARVYGATGAGQALAGVLRAYVCQACGYTEFYTERPDAIPVDGELIYLLEGPEPDPYR